MKRRLLAWMVIALAWGAWAIAQDTAESDYEEFDPGAFDAATSSTVDNRWLPMTPGHRLVFDGETIEDEEAIPHRIVFTPTDLVKTIAGVPTRVVWVQDFSDGELVEAELAFFAQATDGTVWHFGEYPEEYEEGDIVDAPAWLAGVEDAWPGIMMRAQPEVSETSYSQGWGPAVEWADRGRVVAMGQQDCVAAGCYEDVLVTEEFTREEPGAFQVKSYAPGIGNIRVTWRGEDATQETLELTEYVELDESGLLAARAAALELEASAYEQSPDVYGTTEPAEVDSQAM